jgi:hypothetical protein
LIYDDNYWQADNRRYPFGGDSSTRVVAQGNASNRSTGMGLPEISLVP